MTSDMAEMKALLVTHDPPMVDLFRQLLAEISIVAQGCADESAATEILAESKFDALVLDFDNVSASDRLIKSLRASPSNKNALLFAVATYGVAKQKALKNGASFIFERPFAAEQIRVVLRTANAQILRERRKYFRLAAELDVSIQRRLGLSHAVQNHQPQPERNGHNHPHTPGERRIDKAQFPGPRRKADAKC